MSLYDTVSEEDLLTETPESYMTRQQFARNYQNAVSRLTNLIADADTQIDRARTYEDDLTERQYQHLRADYQSQLTALLNQTPVAISNHFSGTTRRLCRAARSKMLSAPTIRPQLVAVLHVEPFRIFTRWSNGECRVNDYNALQTEWAGSSSVFYRQLAQWENFRTVEVGETKCLQWPAVLIEFIDTAGLLRRDPVDFDSGMAYSESQLVIGETFWQEQEAIG